MSVVSVATIAPARCEGCVRNAADPRHTLRFWASYDDGYSEEYDFSTGCFLHVDPAGKTWECEDQGL